jgi:hypothetical protein
VDEGVHVTELQLDRSADIIKPGNSAVLPDDLQAPLQAALVIIRHLKDEKVFKNVAVHIRF